MKAEDNCFRTIVEVPRWKEPMRYDQRFVLLGSCFAQNIGQMFQSYGLQCVCNPLGVTYNPASIAIQVKNALAAETLLSGDDWKQSVFLSEGRWRCWWASSVVSDTDEGRFCETLRNTTSQLGEALQKADYLFITLGTNVCYRLRENGMTVANCHKQPNALFEEVAIDAENCTNILREVMELLTSCCPTLHVVFTVSPYRYRKYGFHGSQLAKATLLLAVDKICRLYPEKAGYFPAYELLLDDLRDYRFYADDMIHPAPAAVNYIWQRMTESCMSEEMQQYLKTYEPIRKALLHRPLNS